MKFTTLLIQAGLIALAQGHYLESSSQESRVQYLNTSTVSLRVGSNQNLRCFDQVNESGYYVNIGTTAVPDLSRSPYNFDNRAVSCRFNGIYFLYDNYNFNPNGNVSAISLDFHKTKSAEALFSGCSLCWNLGRQLQCKFKWLCLQSIFCKVSKKPYNYNCESHHRNSLGWQVLLTGTSMTPSTRISMNTTKGQSNISTRMLPSHKWTILEGIFWLTTSSFA